MDGTKKLASDAEKDIIPTAQPDNKKEEIKEALTHEYY